MSHLCRPRKCIDLKFRLHHMGSSGVQGYDKDQIALVIPYLSNFAVRVPVILGTPTISHVVNVIKEEIYTLGKCPVAYLLADRWATAMIGDGKSGESDPSDYDEIVSTKEAKTIDAFSSRVIHIKMKTAYREEGINVMTEALCVEDESLPRAWWYRMLIWSYAVAVKTLL